VVIVAIGYSTSFVFVVHSIIRCLNQRKGHPVLLAASQRLVGKLSWARQPLLLDLVQVPCHLVIIVRTCRHFYQFTLGSMLKPLCVGTDQV
jgi:hypothetical protein